MECILEINLIFHLRQIYTSQPALPVSEVIMGLQITEK